MAVATIITERLSATATIAIDTMYRENDLGALKRILRAMKRSMLNGKLTIGY